MFLFETENQDATDPTISEEDINKVDLFKDVDINNVTPEQVQAMIKTGKTLQAQKRIWREKATKPNPTEPIAPKPQSTNNPSPEGTTPESETRLRRLELVEEKRQFQHAHSLSPDETDHVFAYAQGQRIEPSDALEQPFMKTALDANRQASRNASATPGSSNRAPKVGGKTFGQMTKDERRANFGEFSKAFQK